jgi:GT2 family glycosyltransferase
VRIAVLVATHNRVEKTIGMIQSFLKDVPSDWDVRFHVADDGSIDGTLMKIEALNIKSVVTSGEGDWFWAKSMSVAQESIDYEFDYIIWVNDDVEINANALKQLALVLADHNETVLIGEFRDPLTNLINYGGYLRQGRHPLKLRRAGNNREWDRIDAGNGNFVMYSNIIQQKTGGIDGRYQHGYADIDFLYRCKNLGFEVKLIPWEIGTCHSNIHVSISGPIARLQSTLSTKNLPIKSQLRFMKRHGGKFWLIYSISPYLKALFVKS